MAAKLPFKTTSEGIIVSIRLTPKAASTRIVGLEHQANGDVALKATVTAVPENGKANKALLKLLSKSWRIGVRNLSLVRGAKDRSKAVLVTGDDSLAAHLAAWVETLPPLDD